jgi:predicted dehydrogenase
MRVGIVGCGNISRVYAERLASFSCLKLVACADLERARAEELAQQTGIPAVSGVEELLASKELDLVVNLTVPAAHASLARAAIAAGKSVYNEKPLGLSFAECRELLEAAERAGVRLGAAPDTFLGAGLQTCKKLIDDGAIGAPVAANAFMLSAGPEGWHPRPHSFYQHGAGPLFDMGPYYITALVALIGPARAITSVARTTHAERVIGSEPLKGQLIRVEVPTHVVTLLEFASGPVGTLVTSFDVQASSYRAIEIYGTEGTLAVPDPNTFGGPVRLRRKGEEEWREIPFSHGYAEQSRGIGVADMVLAIQGGRPHRASGELAAHVVEVMEASLEAAKLGRRVELSTAGVQPAPLPSGIEGESVFAN